MLNKTILAAALIGLSSSAVAGDFKLTSTDISHGNFMPKTQEFNGFGCTGGDKSPQLKWTGAPKGTKSFAVTVHDADAPTGSGWWHWQIVNIPASVTELKAGAGDKSGKFKPAGSQQIENDYGVAAFGGACPPPGHGAHKYKFTVHALSVEKLELPQNASGALAGYMINANSIDTATIEALYKRD
ncbi:YbhB/YbcL family Raf kinase inhibitor-like protein [Catenovulum sp. SX2]|uniref:YbhB/YbcL family Raf kinase inhibitor-like protein n=1 Tax=Catenovulum sp. SX2 TaxID=3398614 RepID=UPI003F87576D